ncbi:MAG: rod shape determining protein RodA, partial [Pseudonocardiales bacterium]|nr:rod shape determining protein RodA [Pseudonocardiales bacterium]
MDLVAGRVWADERRPIRHLDPVLLVTTLLLAVGGLFLVYSATNGSLRALNLDPGTFVKKQVTALVLGFVMLIVVAAFDYRFYKVYAGFIYGATVVALILVRTPLGASPSGAQRWFTFGGFQLTPSEFAKLALAVMVAAVLSELRTAEPTLTDVLRVTLIGAVPMGLVFVQPDIGTTIVLVAIVVGILVVAGTRPRHLATLALASIVLLFGAFQMGIIKDYQLQR